MNFARKLAAVAALSLPLYGVVGVGVANADLIHVVDDDGFASATNCNAGTPAETTIQAGVDEAIAGDTVRVCPGLYEENVTIDKQLTVQGARAGVDARNRLGSLSESVVDPTDDSTGSTFEIAASGVTLDGFYLAGNVNGPAVQTAADESGYRILNNRFISNALGMDLAAGGTTPSTVIKNVFSANNENLGVVPASGNGIYSDRGLSNVLIDNNKFRSNLNAAILVAGQADRVTASVNNSLGDGVFFGAFAGSGYRVINNTVANSSGSGIFFANASGITVQKNKISDSAFSGIRMSGGVSTANVIGNTASGNGDQGISVSSMTPGGVNVRSNTTTANNGDGILFAAGTTGNVIRSNKSSSNGNFDCEDNSTGTGTAGTANSWLSNTGVTSDPARLCTPPV